MTNSSRRAPRPVFVDSTGSRRRWFAILGVAGGALLMLVSAMLIAGFVGGGSGYLPGLPTVPRSEPAVGQPGTQPGDGAPTGPAPGRTPSTSSAPSAGTSKSPVAGPVAPSPGAPGAPATSGQPGRRNTAHPTPSHKN